MLIEKQDSPAANPVKNRGSIASFNDCETVLEEYNLILFICLVERRNICVVCQVRGSSCVYPAPHRQKCRSKYQVTRSLSSYRHYEGIILQ